VKVILGDQTWELDTETLLNTEAILIERQTGWNLLEWQLALSRRSMIAITCVVWLARRRQDPNLEFDDIEFDLKSFDIEHSTPAEQPAEGEGGEPVNPKGAPTET
jgi:hypothetical protein